MTNKNRTKVPTYSEPTTSNKEGGTLKLSSKSHANEQENISKYMNYPNGYFAYLRIGKTGSPIRFYPDAQTAYTATLNEYDSLLSQGVSGSRTSLSISDMNGSIVYEGVPKMNGKIRFSIYEGKDVKNILVLQNWLERIRKEVTNKVLSIKRISDILNFPILAQPTLKKI